MMLTVSPFLVFFVCRQTTDLVFSVLTKVVVYFGIGMLADGGIPFLFEVSGCGVHP